MDFQEIRAQFLNSGMAISAPIRHRRGVVYTNEHDLVGQFSFSESTGDPCPIR